MSIQVLPPLLANQIAAGEVVERPASVVKELVENSLDAGATRIDIDIERGGAKLIRIRDNGSGINKDELALALARHATSKIASLDDLEAIVSMGFRGEALASISSVSRLTLTSRTEHQPEAWQAYAEGREMAVTVKPAAHPVGTTLEVRDLFYNTPARRKFLRTEKTEFAHIDEVVRRIALARFDITLNLNHNSKLVRQYRAVPSGTPRERRLGAICGAAFMEQALAIEWQHGDLALHGWVARPGATTAAMSDIQYCYVNQRMMRDRLINHAIRQACEDNLGAGSQPAFVLYLTVDPHQVDVNVHPAKQEVRFHQSRLVHDFIYQGVLSVFQQQASSVPADNAPAASPPKPDARWQPENRQAAGGNHFAQPPRQESHARAPEAPAYQGRRSDGSSTASAPAGWSPQAPGYQKKQGALYQQLLATPAPPEASPTVMRREYDTAEPALDGHSQSFGRVINVVQGRYALVMQQERLALLALPMAERWLRQAQLQGEPTPIAQPLLIPVRIKLNPQEIGCVQQFAPLIRALGIEIVVEPHHVVVRAVPLPLRQQNLQNLIPELIGYLARHSDITQEGLALWLARHLVSDTTTWNLAQAITLLTDVERLCPHLITSPPEGLLHFVDLQPAMNALLNND